MKNFTIFLFLLSLLTVSCNSGVNRIFGKKTAHEKYEDKLDDLDMDETPQGREWKAVSLKALDQPVPLSLPINIQGQFLADRSRAIGLEFQVRQGEHLDFELIKSRSDDFIIYADLYKKEAVNAVHVLSADPDSSRFSLDADDSGVYILRLQPPLNHTGKFTLTVSSGPSIGFPVSDKKARIGSFWGDDRDGGKRRHEGIDIFAPKKSPAIAAADGYITSVSEEALGGKTVWLRPSGKNYSLYYAHLDQQSVSPGQFVKKGETIGLVGNTGNAQHTPAHLHFGIYTRAGAVDPFPFVNKTVKTAPAVVSKDLDIHLELVKSLKSPDGTLIKAKTILIPLAATARSFIAELPEGQIILVTGSSVKTKSSKSKNSALVSKPETPSKKS